MKSYAGFTIGDRVRDLGLYRDHKECDGVVVCVLRKTWIIHNPTGDITHRKQGWRRELITTAFSLVIKFRDGSVRFYNPHGSTTMTGRQSILEHYDENKARELAMLQINPFKGLSEEGKEDSPKDV